MMDDRYRKHQDPGRASKAWILTPLFLASTILAAVSHADEADSKKSGSGLDARDSGQEGFWMIGGGCTLATWFFPGIYPNVHGEKQHGGVGYHEYFLSAHPEVGYVFRSSLELHLDIQFGEYEANRSLWPNEAPEDGGYIARSKSEVFAFSIVPSLVYHFTRPGLSGNASDIPGHSFFVGLGMGPMISSEGTALQAIVPVGAYFLNKTCNIGFSMGPLFRHRYYSDEIDWAGIFFSFDAVWIIRSSSSKKSFSVSSANDNPKRPADPTAGAVRNGKPQD